MRLEKGMKKKPKQLPRAEDYIGNFYLRRHGDLIQIVDYKEDRGKECARNGDDDMLHFVRFSEGIRPKKDYMRKWAFDEKDYLLIKDYSPRMLACSEKLRKLYFKILKIRGRFQVTEG